jgi:hypothetical protein
MACILRRQVSKALSNVYLSPKNFISILRVVTNHSRFLPRLHCWRDLEHEAIIAENRSRSEGMELAWEITFQGTGQNRVTQGGRDGAKVMN